MRLDKLLAKTGFGSRKNVKQLIKEKRVTINDAIVRDPSQHVNLDAEKVLVDGAPVNYQEFYYLMLNKAPGYISATEDRVEKTVIDLLPQHYQALKLFPVGRLDKDTEGLLLLTNDGELGHILTSPRQEIIKVYYAKIIGKVTEEDAEAFAKGVTLKDGYVTKPAQLKIKSADEISEIEVTITEGKFHQVKRMFEAVGKEVQYLQRIKMGEIELDRTLAIGDFRELKEAELAYCLGLKEGR